MFKITNPAVLKKYNGKAIHVGFDLFLAKKLHKKLSEPSTKCQSCRSLALFFHYCNKNSQLFILNKQTIHLLKVKEVKGVKG